MTRALARPDGASLKMRRRRADVSSAMVKHVTVTWQEPLEAGAKSRLLEVTRGRGSCSPTLQLGWQGVGGGAECLCSSSHD